MATTVEFKNLEQVIDALDNYGLASVKAMRTTLNESGRFATSQALRNIVKADGGYNVKQKDVRKGIDIKKATMANLTYQFRLKTVSIPLMAFGARDRRKRGMGVSFKVKKGGGRGVLPQAFIATSTKGRGDHVLQRKGDERYPLNVFASITPTSMFINTKSDHLWFNRFMQKFDERYWTNVKHFSK